MPHFETIANKYGFKHVKTEFSSEYQKYIKGEKYILYQGVSIDIDDNPTLLLLSIVRI